MDGGAARAEGTRRAATDADPGGYRRTSTPQASAPPRAGRRRHGRDAARAENARQATTDA
ncbi:hypothetical protein [Streptomyces sp. NPDC004100]